MCVVGEKKIVPHWYEIFCSCLLWAHNCVTKDAVLTNFFILPLGRGHAIVWQETATREEMGIRNLVLTLSLVVLVGCFSVLVWSGPVSGQEAFNSSSALWSSKKRGDNSRNGIAVTLTLYCISLIKFIPSA